MRHNESPGTSEFRKEMIIRRRMAKIYNKTEEDFKTLREYNDYLESVEDMTYDLVIGVNKQEIEKAIEAYKNENEDLILRNEIKKGMRLQMWLRNLPEEDAEGAAIQFSYGDKGVAPAVVPKPSGPLKGLKLYEIEDFPRYVSASGGDFSLSDKRAEEELFSSLFL